MAFTSWDPPCLDTGIMLDYNCRDASLQYLTFVYYIQGAPIKTEDWKCTRGILGYYEAFYGKKNMQRPDALASLAPLNIFLKDIAPLWVIALALALVKRFF